MLTQEQLKQYQNDGYIIFENLFTEAEMDRITVKIDKFDEESERALQEQGKNSANSHIIPGQINFTIRLNLLDKEIQQFAMQEKFADISTGLIGPEVQLYFDQSVYKRPEANRDFPWHQDNGYVPIEPQHYVTCWLALEDASIENGCIWVLPGSHKQGLVEHKKTDVGWQCYFGEDPGIPVELKKGSMVAFNSLLFHRSTPNRSDKIRKGYILQYSQTGAKNPDTGVVFDNGPVIAKNGLSVLA